MPDRPEPPTFRYTDADGDELDIDYLPDAGKGCVPVLRFATGNDSNGVFVPLADTEQVVAAIRAASGVQPARYRLLLERLEAARARALTSARHIEPEVALTADGMASGYLHAITDAVFVFEGPEAAQAYAEQATASGVQPDTRPECGECGDTGACNGGPCALRTDTERDDRYAAAIGEATGNDWPTQAFWTEASAALAVADKEQRDLRRKLALSELIRENADFHLGQEMARRQVAEKEAARLRAELGQARATVLRERADFFESVLRDSLDPDSDGTRPSRMGSESKIYCGTPPPITAPPYLSCCASFLRSTGLA
ncbi:hypothetical protein ACFVSQ_29825 [Streptomyces niveus]|uniref:hypothetical protein n=1 Tax=Streptomyces niveus TaxID=193462 RepID=UPI0036EA01ED